VTVEAVSAETTIKNGFEFGNSEESRKDYGYAQSDFTKTSKSTSYLEMYTMTWKSNVPR